jgi:hypothetical protein
LGISLGKLVFGLSGIRWEGNINMDIREMAMLSGSLVTMAWRVLRLWMEEKASRYGG